MNVLTKTDPLNILIYLYSRNNPILSRFKMLLYFLYIYIYNFIYYFTVSVSVLVCQLAAELDRSFQKTPSEKCVINLCCSVSCWWYEELCVEMKWTSQESRRRYCQLWDTAIAFWSGCLSFKLKSHLMPLSLRDLNLLSFRAYSHYEICSTPEGIWPPKSGSFD